MSLLEGLGSLMKYELTKRLKKNLDITQATTSDEILSLMSSLHWKRLDALRERANELAAHKYKIRDFNGYEEMDDISYLIIDTKMIRIFEDPQAPDNLKKQAIEFIECEKAGKLEEAFSKPENSSDMGAVVVRGGRVYRPRSWYTTKY